MATDTKTYSTPDGVVSWPSLFSAQLPKDAKEGDKAKYSVTLLFTAEDMATAEFKALKQLVINTAIAKWPTTGKAMLEEKSLRLPFRTDIAAKGYPDQFKCFLRLQSVNQPGVVDRYADPKTGKARVITDPKEIYAGCIGRATVGAYAYGGPGTKFSPGVGLGLRNFQLRNEAGKTYERLDGRSSGEDDFGAEPATEANDFGAGESLPTSSKDDLNDLLS